MASARSPQAINLQPVGHGSLNKILPNDTYLAVLTFNDWPFYPLRNSSDGVIQREVYTTLLYVCIFVHG